VRSPASISAAMSEQTFRLAFPSSPSSSNIMPVSR
jgi:hypothetical protein